MGLAPKQLSPLASPMHAPLPIPLPFLPKPVKFRAPENMLVKMPALGSID